LRALQVFCREQAALAPTTNAGLRMYADAIIEPRLAEADRAATSGDIVRIIQAFAAMKEIQD